uniref:C-type lectin domain-containing protein n=1 Tax=Myripristis murdjan TaxID=586833 RepID=A0A668AGS9_9TELE
MVLRSKSGEYTVTRGEQHAGIDPCINTNTNVHTKNFHARDHTTNCRDALACFIGEHGRAAAVCLGLLCLLLLSTVIGLVAHCENQLQTSLNSTTQEKHQLQMEIERLTLNIKELTSQICPEGWSQFSSSCYFISSESKSWDESRQDCLRRGADLVIINSREENSFLKNFRVQVWIGLSDQETEGEWKWVDGSSLSYKSWAEGQPDDRGGREDCGEVRPAYDGWNDAPCSDGQPWICEKKTPVHPAGI